MTPEQLEALLDAKLKPLEAKLEALAPQQKTTFPTKPLVLLLSALAATVAAVLIAGRIILAPAPDAGQASSSERLVYSDDFSDPSRGLFLGRQDGTATLPGDRASAKWDYTYRDGSLVAHVSPPSVPLNGRLIGGSARSANPLTGNFAVEVRARATANVEHAVLGLRLYPGGRDFAFGLRPSSKTYEVWEIFKEPMLSAQNPVIDSENLLRLEVRGASLRLSINGQPLRALQDEPFGARPASVGVFFDTTAAPGEDPVEIRYSDFKVFAL